MLRYGERIKQGQAERRGEAEEKGGKVKRKNQSGLGEVSRE